MGDTSRWDHNAWATHQTQTQHQTQQQIFKSVKTANDMDPRNITVRESCDSEINPNSTPVIVAVDHTGSMGHLATEIIKNGLGVIMKEIYERKPISDPHVMCMAVGDGYSDTSPLQVTQFESDISLAEQVKKFHIEGEGGGNGGESYNLVWHFAATKTKCDALIKRGKKGYLFTIGDEPPHTQLTPDVALKVFDQRIERAFQNRELLDLVSQGWEVFHLIVNPGSYDPDRWKALLGERAIEVSDHTKLAEIIVSTIQVVEGDQVDDVVNSWSGDTSVVVANAVGGLVKAGGAGSDVVRL